MKNCECCGDKMEFEFVAKSKKVCKKCRNVIDWYVALVISEYGKE